MKILGLIVEYNPFHNGHIYHIKKAKEIIQPDYTIAIMSSSFVQRGEPAIIDKWKRSEIALQYGVDLVIELPFVYACQSADYFAKGAIQLLNAIGVSDICFGSESGHIETFIEIAHAIDNNQAFYNHLVKESMQKGSRYADACNSALKKIMHKEVRTPNDLLGLSYVKEIILNHYPITPHCIQRTNDFHHSELSSIASASTIRKAIYKQEDISHTLPFDEFYKDEIYCFDDFFPYLQYQVLTSTAEELKNYHMVDEGLENLLIAKISVSHQMEDIVQGLLSKRYTRPRIQRMIIHILMKNTKKEITKAMNVDYLRILSMNEKGRTYLNMIKKECPYHLVTNFSNYQHPALTLEFKATKLLSLLSQRPEDIIKEEYAHIPLKKDSQ